MEFWRTDEIAPVVLIILFELMVLGPDQLHDADLMSVVECGCTHSGSASRQDWPGYCFWLGFLQVCDSCPWSGRITPFARLGQGLFCIPLSSLPPRCPTRVKFPLPIYPNRAA